MAKFEVGKIYITSDWFTGATMKFQYEGNGKFSVEDFNVDGPSHREENYEILTNEKGEYVVLHEYHGHEHRITSYDN